jgi:hypothetical protein
METDCRTDGSAAPVELSYDESFKTFYLESLIPTMTAMGEDRARARFDRVGRWRRCESNSFLEEWPSRRDCNAQRDTIQTLYSFRQNGRFEFDVVSFSTNF